MDSLNSHRKKISGYYVFCLFNLPLNLLKADREIIVGAISIERSIPIYIYLF